MGIRKRLTTGWRSKYAQRQREATFPTELEIFSKCSPKSQLNDGTIPRELWDDFHPKQTNSKHGDLGKIVEQCPLCGSLLQISVVGGPKSQHIPVVSEGGWDILKGGWGHQGDLYPRGILTSKARTKLSKRLLDQISKKERRKLCFF